MTFARTGRQGRHDRVLKGSMYMICARIDPDDVSSSVGGGPGGEAYGRRLQLLQQLHLFERSSAWSSVRGHICARTRYIPLDAGLLHVHVSVCLSLSHHDLLRD